MVRSGSGIQIQIHQKSHRIRQKKDRIPPDPAKSIVSHRIRQKGPYPTGSWSVSANLLNNTFTCLLIRIVGIILTCLNVSRSCNKYINQFCNLFRCVVILPWTPIAVLRFLLASLQVPVPTVFFYCSPNGWLVPYGT